MDEKVLSQDAVSFKYDFDALLNYRDGELGAFHVGYFDSTTTSYRAALENLVRKAAEPLKNSSCFKIIDIGCGCGYPSRQLQSFLNASVIGVDFSIKSIEIANKIHAAEVEKGNLTFLQMNAYNLMFQENSFDGVFAIESLFHMDKLRAIQEMYRVLRIGGVISICDYYAKPGWKGLIQEGFSEVISLEDFLQIFRQCGFKNIQFSDWTEHVKPSYQYLRNRKMISHVQKDFEEFCENAGKNSGYTHIFAEK
jgi:ubiquinone/menaquinone biosynthesis C-methylase UbiE